MVIKAGEEGVIKAGGRMTGKRFVVTSSSLSQHTHTHTHTPPRYWKGYLQLTMATRYVCTYLTTALALGDMRLITHIHGDGMGNDS